MGYCSSLALVMTRPDLEGPNVSDEETLSLGERLRLAVSNRWQQVNSQEKVLDHHGQQIEALRGEFTELKKQVHGLKVSKDKALAQNARLKKTIADAESGLAQIDRALH